MVCLGKKKKLGSTSRWIVPVWSIYIPVRPKNLHLSSLSKQKFFCRSFEISSLGKFGIDQTIHFLRNMLVESRINPKFPVTANCKILFAERRWMKIYRPNRYVNASFEWPILEQLMRMCCQIFSCPDRPSKLRYFSMVKRLQTTQHKTNQETRAYQRISDKLCSLPVNLIKQICITGKANHDKFLILAQFCVPSIPTPKFFGSKILK